MNWLRWAVQAYDNTIPHRWQLQDIYSSGHKITTDKNIMIDLFWVFIFGRRCVKTTATLVTGWTASHFLVTLLQARIKYRGENINGNKMTPQPWRSQNAWVKQQQKDGYNCLSCSANSLFSPPLEISREYLFQSSVCTVHAGLSCLWSVLLAECLQPGDVLHPLSWPSPWTRQTDVFGDFLSTTTSKGSVGVT